MMCSTPRQLAFSQQPRRLPLETMTLSDSPKASSAPRPIADSSDWSDDDSDYMYSTGYSTGSGERSTSIAVSSFIADRQIEPCSMHYARQHQHYRTNARRLALCGMLDELQTDHQRFDTGDDEPVDHNVCGNGPSEAWYSLDSEQKKNPNEQLEERCEQADLEPMDGCDQSVSMLDTSDLTPETTNGNNDHETAGDELHDTVTQAQIAVEDARVRFNDADSADDSLAAWNELLAARQRLSQVTTSSPCAKAHMEEDSEGQAQKPTLTTCTQTTVTHMALEEFVHREMVELSPETGAPRCLTYWNRRREKVEASRKVHGPEPEIAPPPLPTSLEAAKEQGFNWADNSHAERELKAGIELSETCTEYASNAGIKKGLERVETLDDTFLIFGFEN